MKKTLPLILALLLALALFAGCGAPGGDEPPADVNSPDVSDAAPAAEKNMTTEEAQQAVETAMQDLVAEAFGDRIVDYRIEDVTIFSDEELGSELAQELQLGPDAYAFSVAYALQPAEGIDPIELTASNGEIDEATGWVVDKSNIGVLRLNDAGDPPYVITDFGTGF